jgi:hypothetical protein
MLSRTNRNTKIHSGEESPLRLFEKERLGFFLGFFPSNPPRTALSLEHGALNSKFSPPVQQG